MDQRNFCFELRTKEYLKQIGLRSNTKAYQYLLFALVQLQQDTPFKNSIWELTAIYYGQSRRNVLACVRRELHRAFQEESLRFMNPQNSFTRPSPPNSTEFLQWSLHRLKQGNSYHKI